MYIGFIWLTTSLVILLAACINRDTHLQSRTRRHEPHTDQLFCNWHCLAVRRSLREGPMVWLNRAKHPQSVTESPKWEKTSAGNCVLCDAARWLHLQDVARFDGTPVHTIRRSLSSFYWTQKRPTDCQLHYVQVSCFFGQQLWQLRTAMYLPLPKCVWISQMFSKIGRMFLHRISSNVWKITSQITLCSSVMCGSIALNPYISASQSNVFHTRAVHVVHWAVIVPKRRVRNECAKKRKKIWGSRKSDKWRSRAIHRWEPTAFTFDWEFTSSVMLRCVNERLFPDVLEDRKAFVCWVMQPKSTASLGSLKIKLVLLAEPPELYMIRGLSWAN